MKLADLINALAEEVEVVQPELEQYLADLSSDDVDEEDFIDATDAYLDQVERMGEAAEMIEFFGLQQACEHIVENIAAFRDNPNESREAYLDMLAKWPEVVIHYLKNSAESSSIKTFVSFLNSVPKPLDEEEKLAIMHSLSTFTSSAQSSFGEENAARRPVLASPDDVSLTVPDDVDPNLLEGFYQEAPGQTEALIPLLNSMVSEQGSLSDLVSAKRIVHTLKGTGALIGLTGIANLGHHFEDILDYFESHDGAVNPQIASVLLDGGNCLAQMIAYLMGNDDYPEQSLSVLQNIIDIANIIDRGGDLDNIHLRNQSAPVMAPAPVEKKAPVATGGTGKTGALRVSMKRIDELFRISAEISVHSSAMEAQIKLLGDFTKRLASQELRIKKRLFELETIVDVRSLAMMTNKPAGGDGQFDPLELEQYNELHSTTHALLEEFNDMMLLSNQLSDNILSLKAQENQQQVLSRDLQHLVIGTRMAEVGSLESRLQRNIRNTCQMTGKQARLELIGGDTLMDSDVLSQLAEPLLHLLRNAIDHGIESPEEREAKGKDPVGTVILEFSSQGQQILLRCQDDGKGLDYQRILEKAMASHLIAKDEKLSENEIGQLIFHSGFSTRDTVSQVSGRGVGMDVVRNWLNTVNGNIRVTSEKDKYTAMLMSFPSSMTTVQSLVVRSAGQAFALPSVQVKQALAQVEGQFVESGDALQYHYNGKVYAAKRLSDLLGFESEHSLEESFAVLMNIHDEMWAVAVDWLIDSRELLLKPPGLYIRHIPGIIGTSILGDGSIAIHLDMPLLMDRATGVVRQLPDTERKSNNQNTTNVLIVDDSLSVRNTLLELIGDAGFNVKAARDGIEAVNLLDKFTPSVVLTDLEMPNMNGIELTTHIRNRAGFESLPIIMITSRSQDKHKETALRAGVDYYLTKPYNDTELLQTIGQAMTAVAH